MKGDLSLYTFLEYPRQLSSFCIKLANSVRSEMLLLSNSAIGGLHISKLSGFTVDLSIDAC